MDGEKKNRVLAKGMAAALSVAVLASIGIVLTALFGESESVPRFASETATVVVSRTQTVAPAFASAAEEKGATD